MPYNLICEECLKPFTAAKMKQQFCSIECFSLYRHYKWRRILELKAKGIDVKKLCFFNWRIPLAEIERLMELKK